MGCLHPPWPRGTHVGCLHLPWPRAPVPLAVTHDGVRSHLSWPQVLTQVLTDSVLLVGALGVLFFILNTLLWPQKHLAHFPCLFFF